MGEGDGEGEKEERNKKRGRRRKERAVAVREEGRRKREKGRKGARGRVLIDSLHKHSTVALTSEHRGTKYAGSHTCTSGMALKS